MNERIRELALQAGEYVNEVYTPPVSSKTPGKIWEDGHVDWHTQFNQKFTELVVKECCKTLEEMHRWQSVNNQNYPSAWHDAVDQGIENIKQHFGVEE